MDSDDEAYVEKCEHASKHCPALPTLLMITAVETPTAPLVLALFAVVLLGIF